MIERAMARAGSPVPRRRPQLPDEVASHVREQIMTGSLREGDYLRLEYIADELGISVTPVREALLALRGDGFVELEPRQGFTVRALSRRDLSDVYWVQATLAGELASRVAATVTSEELDELDAVQSDLEAAAQRGDTATVEALDSRFHDDLSREAASDKLTWFLGIAVRYAPQHLATVTGWPEASANDHAAILRALHDRDAEAARTAMTAHITHMGELLIEQLERRGFWDEQV